MSTAEHHVRPSSRHPPTDVLGHAEYLIEQRMDDWRKLQEALCRAESKVREAKARKVQALEMQFLQANVRLLDVQCDRALQSLGAAVAARRAAGSANITRTLN